LGITPEDKSFPKDYEENLVNVSYAFLSCIGRDFFDKHKPKKQFSKTYFCRAKVVSYKQSCGWSHRK
jgi:hypothetical protein